MEIRRCRGDAGANLVEYGLLVALILLLALGAITYFGSGSDANLTSSCEQITGAAC